VGPSGCGKSTTPGSSRGRPAHIGQGARPRPQVCGPEDAAMVFQSPVLPGVEPSKHPVHRGDGGKDETPYRERARGRAACGPRGFEGATRTSLGRDAAESFDIGRSSSTPHSS
jgi:hypothetical protein